MFFVIVLIGLGIIALAIFLYKILKEEGENVIEEKKREEEEKKKKIDSTYMGQINISGFESVYASVKGDKDKIDMMRSEIQEEARRATKAGNRDLARKYSEYLKKLDE